MNPSAVRARILQDHHALRAHLTELENAVAAMLTDETQAPLVTALARQMLDELVQHTELEDSILAPALLDIDAWGPLRASQLLEHHQAQRAQVRELAVLYTLGLDRTGTDVALVVLGFVRDLRADMEHEERDLLTADLLRDDLIAIASEGG